MYYILKNTIGLTSNPDCMNCIELIQGLSFPETWDKIVETYKNVRANFEKNIVNTGKPEKQFSYLDTLSPAPCTYCEYKSICQIKETTQDVSN